MEPGPLIAAFSAGKNSECPPALSLGLLDSLRGRGHQRRGPCPIHSQAGDTQPTFSAHLGKQVFQCFQADCRAQGNVLDLWAAVHKLPPL